MSRKRERRNRQLIRVLQLLNMLSNQPMGYTIQELTSRLRTTRRTLYRDLEALHESGIYFEREILPDRRVRLRLPQEYRFVKTNFDENELFSLFFAKNLLKPLQDTPFGRGMESALEKIYKLLPANVQDYCFFTESFFVFKQPFTRSYKEFETNIRQLKDAILTDRICEIEYVKGDRADRHTIHPYFMTYLEGLLYVIAHSEQRGDRRTFRVDRIRRIRILNRRFERPPDYQPENFEPDRLLGRSLKIYSDRRTHRIEIVFPKELARMIRERTWHTSQKIRPGRDGSVRLSMELPITPEVISWILSFGDQARVVRPPELSRRIAGILVRAARQYHAG